MTGIYCYYNKINGKRYIGQAVDLTRRKKDHKTRAFHIFYGNNEYDSAIHRAFRKYGYENFEYSILEECQIQELNEREIYWIQYYNSKDQGYNCDDGGGTSKHFCKINQKTLELIKKDLIETTLTYESIKDKYGVSVGFVGDFNNGKIWREDGIDYPLRKKTKKQFFCSNCGTELYEESKTGYCQKCYHIFSRKTDRPTRDELKRLIRNFSFVEIGRQYNVSDNAIKKWCDGYNLPRKKADIKLISDEEWQKI
jgi:group I intron endonuclease